MDAIADYIALDNPSAARTLARNVFAHVDQLEAHPDSGSFPHDLSGKRYRHIVAPPCRVIHRHARKEGVVYIMHVMRSEQKFRRSKLRRGVKK
jgi:plasmid stabilization system protein ParE